MGNKQFSNDYLETNLTGKTVVFSGGTDGMGKEAVKKMVKMGASIVLFGRNKEKTIAVVEELNGLTSNESRVKWIHCDLASLASIRKAAQEVLDTCPKIDYLINCAGANMGERKMTEDGHEMTWTVNHLAPFLLNNLLLERLTENTRAKIVNLSSATERFGHIHFDDIHLSKGWSTWTSYTQAKLAMNMMTRKMAIELEGTGVTINSLNPGFIKTNLLRDLTGIEKFIGVPYMRYCAAETEVGGDRILRVALSKDFDDISGMYIYEDSVRDPNPEALDDKLVEKTWKLSKEHVGLAA